jgi:Zn-finger protein
MTPKGCPRCGSQRIQQVSLRTWKCNSCEKRWKVKGSHQEHHYAFFEYRQCEFFPCHKGLKELNCLFCFCPVYTDWNCPGKWSLTPDGVKDCSKCTKFHRRSGYDQLMEYLKGNGAVRTCNVV